VNPFAPLSPSGQTLLTADQVLAALPIAVGALHSRVAQAQLGAYRQIRSWWINGYNSPLGSSSTFVLPSTVQATLGSTEQVIASLTKGYLNAVADALGVPHPIGDGLGAAPALPDDGVAEATLTLPISPGEETE
jgi:hypothetical protein